MRRIVAFASLVSAAAAGFPADAQNIPTVTLVGVPDAMARQINQLLPNLGDLPGAPCPGVANNPFFRGGHARGDGKSGTGAGSAAACAPPHVLKSVDTFSVGGVQLTAPPPLRYQVVGGYAYYLTMCRAEGAKQESAPGGFPANRVLPPLPPLSSDTSITIKIDRTLNMSFSDAEVANGFFLRANALKDAFEIAVSSGAGKSAVSNPVLPSGFIPRPTNGSIVLAVSAHYDLAYANYLALLYPAQVTLDGTSTTTLAQSSALAVKAIGQLSGGSWNQGSGLLFIPAPNAYPVPMCKNGFFLAPAGADLLAAHGVSTTRAFAPPANAVFVRTTD